MKIWASMDDEDWLKIEPYVTCEFSNPMDGEFVFVDPDPMLFWRLASMGIPFGISEDWQHKYNMLL